MRICRGSLFKYVVSKFGLQHHRSAVVGRRDCSRRCRQCLCSRAAGAGGGRWPRSVRAFNPCPAISHCSRLLYSVLARILYCALCSPCAAQGLSRVEGLCRPGAGRCSAEPTNPAAAAAAGRQTGRAIPAHCVTADASITPAYHILAPTPCSNVQKCDICRSPPWGHINQAPAEGRWSLVI